MEKLFDDERHATQEAKALHIDLVEKPVATQRRAASGDCAFNVFSFDVGL